MAGRDSLIQLFAGASGGTMGAIVTCPLEVVKTRLQSSQSGFSAAVGAPLSGPAGRAAAGGGQRLRFSTAAALRDIHCLTQSAAARCPPPPPASGPTSLGLVHCMRLIVQSEGVPALFKGLGPNLVGVAPSRAIYFCAYQNAKTFFNQHMTPDTSAVHTVSAISAGLTSSTVTNPIWMVKTRLQLDRQRYGSRLLLADCVRRIYARHGLLGFYKGVSASYYGVTETVIHFVLYEKMKRKINARRAARTDKTLIDFVEFMMAGALSKTVASCVAYPHEVARTRLREEGNKYRSFVQTLRLVWHEEGHRGLYRGLGIQLLRQIPNTAIVMATYEACVYFLRDRPAV